MDGMKAEEDSDEPDDNHDEIGDASNGGPGPAYGVAGGNGSDDHALGDLASSNACSSEKGHRAGGPSFCCPYRYAYATAYRARNA